MTSEKIARVYMLESVYHIDKLYDYIIPDGLSGAVRRGDVVVAPFGGGNRTKTALVYDIADTTDCANLKRLTGICGIRLSDEMLGLCAYMKEHIFCTMGDAVRAMAPTFAIPLLNEYFSVSEKAPHADMNATEKSVMALLGDGKAKSLNRIRDLLSLSDTSVLYAMERKGLLCRETRVSERRRSVAVTVSLTEDAAKLDPDEVEKLAQGPKQKELLHLLATTGEEKLSDLISQYGIAKSTVDALVSRGVVCAEEEQIFRDPYSKLGGDSPLPILSKEQRDAADEIIGITKSGKAGAALLYGVTGSGKTSVIGEVIDSVIKSGKQVIMLVPEIALTPQAVGVFYNRYKGRTAVLHSGLSDGERFDAWNRIKRREVDLCIGTRSAVFAPFENLGLIVIDEEHEHTYRSDMSPKYHARDIARYRCAHSGATMLLSSATPSLDSFSKAKEGKYRLVRLTERYGGARLPDVIFSDMRGETSVSPIGRGLEAKIGETLENGEQAILFINRRGYNNFLSCPFCGEPVSCPHCSVSYTYHTMKTGGRGYLYCHYCGSKESAPAKCPSCGGEPLRRMGFGTQMVEDELKKLFPKAHVLRLDSDSASGRQAYDSILGRFRRKEADVLVGTQMVTKGHDFPDVTLVGVLNADTALYQSSYSACEHAFSVFTQVIGRAGRSEKHGTALMQTYSPDNPTLGLVKNGEYERMFEEEIALRRSLVFPPYCDLAVVELSSADERELDAKISEAAAKLRGEKRVPMTVFGPMDAPIYKVNGVYRSRIVIKCRLSAETRKIISDFYAETIRNAGFRVNATIDINPSDL